MSSRSAPRQPLPGLHVRVVALVATVVVVTPVVIPLPGCATTTPAADAPIALSGEAPTPPRSARDAARIAIERSPRVAAARHAFEAACARRRAIEVPPDLRIELMTGIPLMEMGATPLRVSLGTSLAWLLNRDNLVSAANRQVDAAAATLATAACEVASEAREAYRTVLARALLVDAARARRAALAAILEADGAAARAGERSQGEVDAIGSRLADAERAVHAADGRLALAKVALDSLVGGEEAPAETDASIEAIVADADATTGRVATRAEAVAAATVAERRRILAALEPALGAAFDGSAGFERDMEGDEMVFAAIGVTIPTARLPREIEAARASLAEAEAAYAEAVRVAELEAHSARIELGAASDALDAARAALAASRRALAATEAASTSGERSRIELARSEIARADAAESVGLAALAWCAALGRLERLHPLAEARTTASRTPIEGAGELR